MEQKGSEKLSVQDIPQREVENACFHALGLIGRNCEYLDQHLAHAGGDEKSRRAVADISASAAQLDRTMNEVMSLLEFLRADEDPKLAPLDICELMAQVAAQSDMIRAQLGVELELDFGGWTTCRVLAEQDDTELLFLHLLSNALRACSPGGKIRIGLRRSDAFWQLTIADNGCGLPGEGQAWIENRRRFLGSARLGLLLCRECCRRMQWGLQVERGPVQGTQAVVTIPLSAGGPKGDKKPDRAELHSPDSLAAEQRQYRLRAMLVRELKTMPELGDPEEDE